MNYEDLTIGFALTGSFCTFKIILTEVKKLVDAGASIIPIMSENVQSIDTRFGKADDFIREIESITGNKIINNIAAAEPIGPQNLLDILVVAPCTGNTIAKIANGITDTCVTMAVKAQLRNQKPVVIAVSTNDGLGINAKNIVTLLNTRNIYLVPFRQDDPVKKKNSLVAKMDYIMPTLEKALKGEQIQPVMLGPEE